MNKILMPFLLVLVGFVPMLAMAENFDSSTSIYLSARNCIAGETACDSIDRSHAREIAGLPGSSESEASLKEDGFGSAHGRVSNAGAPGSAALVGSSKTEPGKRNGFSGYLLQHYKNDTGATQTINLDGTLTYSQTVPEANQTFPSDGGGRTVSFSELMLFKMTAETFDFGSSPEENFRAMNEGDSPPDGFELLGTETSEGKVPVSTGSGEVELSLTVDLEPGEGVWMMVVLQVLAANGAQADGELNTSFGVNP